MKLRPALLATMVGTLMPVLSIALTVEPQDCREGAEFIGNAARSRDNGLTAQAFLDRLESDLLAIRSYPRALRWFARDPDDEALLTTWAQRVFAGDESPHALQRAFLASCSQLVESR